jgi:hypothetical protein
MEALRVDCDRLYQELICTANALSEEHAWAEQLLSTLELFLDKRAFTNYMKLVVRVNQLHEIGCTAKKMLISFPNTGWGQQQAE